MVRRVAYRPEVSPLRIGSTDAQVFCDFVHLRGQGLLTLDQGLLTLGQVLLTLSQVLLTLSQFAQALESLSKLTEGQKNDLQRKIESIIER